MKNSNSSCFLSNYKVILTIILFSIIFGFPARLLSQDNQKNKQTSDNKESLFPLMHSLKKKAIKAGAEFPKPYGVSASMYFQKNSMEITKISLGGITLDGRNGIIDFKESVIKNTVTTSQVRADLWLLPFVNFYGMAGRITSFNDINLDINLSVPPLPGITNGDIKLLERREISNVNGTVVGVGTVIAGGYKKLFVNVNLTWAKTYLNEVNSKQKAFVAFPMVGITTKFANIFIGGIYQNTGQLNKGSFKKENGETLNYSLEFNSEKWNYNVGFNKSIGNWSVVVVQGFGARTNSVIEVGYRFGN